jgi:hypothetical protein
MAEKTGRQIGQGDAGIGYLDDDRPAFGDAALISFRKG